MKPASLWPIIVSAGALTFALRWSFIALVDTLELPPGLRRSLRFVPAAVLSAIVCPAVLVVNGDIALSVANPRLIAALVAAVIAWRTRGIFYTIATGMAVLWALIALGAHG